MEKLIANLKKRKMNGYIVESIEQAVEKIYELLPVGASVGFGGSVTLEQIGILDELRQRSDFDLLDRTQIKDPADLPALYQCMFAADVFLSSCNAITEKGQIVNVDGRGNRVAAITFGPKKVVIIAGRNKITPDLNSAMDRVKKVAAPMNVKRVNEAAKASGNAAAFEWDDENIWGQVSIIERQLDPERIHVILVNEELGY